MSTLLCFESEGVFVINGKDCFVVKNDQTCFNFSHVIGHDILIDGIKKTALGVEFNAHASPWKQGESISIMCE